MNKYLIIGAVGAVAVAGYFVYTATASGSSSECAGDWTDNFNPACLIQSAGNYAKNELNTVLIILGLIIVLVIGLLAFGPGTEHIAKLGSLAVL